MPSKILFYLLFFFIFWNFFLPGPKVASDYHYFFKEVSDSLLSIPYTWRDVVTAEGLGEYSLATLWSWPVNVLYGIFSNLGVEYSVLFLLLGIIPILLLEVVGMSSLLTSFGVKGKGRLVGVLFYSINTYVLLLIDGGQINLALAYACMPIVFLFYRRTLEKSDWNNRLFFILTSLAISFFDFRIIYLVFILLFINFIFEILGTRKNFLSELKKFILLGSSTGVVMLGVHSYWILPAILGKAPNLPLTYDRVAQIDFLSFGNLAHSIYLLQPHWYKNVFGQITPLRPEFVFIPLLVFLAPILKRHDRLVAFWVLISLIGIFLSKGSQEPFSNIYIWAFSNVPGFSLFRDPTKFFFFVALSYSILMAITIDQISKINLKRKFLNKIFSLLPILVILYLIWLVRPVWLGQMTGTFTKPLFEKEYLMLADYLKQDQKFGRVFWIPTMAPLGYSSNIHPSVEASRLSQKRPFAIGTVGNYETFNFIREAEYMGEIFDIAAIKYIVYPYPNAKREQLKPDNIAYYHLFLNQITSLPWIRTKKNDSSVPIIETKENQDHLFLISNLFWVIGADKIYQDLVSLPNFKLKNNGLIFVEEYPDLVKRFNDFKGSKFLLYGKDPVDLYANLIDSQKMIFPAKNLDFNPNKAGWWKRESADLIYWRTFLQEKYQIDNLDFDYGGGWAASEGNSTLKIQDDKIKKDNIVLIRAMKSAKGGKISFHQGNLLIGELNTFINQPEKAQLKLTGNNADNNKVFSFDEAKFNWVEIGTLLNNEASLEIKTEGRINVINSIAILPREDWLKIKEEGNNLISQGKVVMWKNLDRSAKEALFNKETKTKIKFQNVNPTYYKVNITNSDGPIFLALSENYDPFWQINDKDAVPLYSLINGFELPEDGQYQIFFKSQKYVQPGLVLSFLTSILLLLMLLVSFRSKTRYN